MDRETNYYLAIRGDDEQIWTQGYFNLAKDAVLEGNTKFGLDGWEDHLKMVQLTNEYMSIVYSNAMDKSYLDIIKYIYPLYFTEGLPWYLNVEIGYRSIEILSFLITLGVQPTKESLTRAIKCHCNRNIKKLLTYYSHLESDILDAWLETEDFQTLKIISRLFSKDDIEYLLPRIQQPKLIKYLTEKTINL